MTRRFVYVRPRVLLASVLTLVLGYAGLDGAVTFTLERVSGTSGSAPPPVRGEVVAQGFSADGRLVLLRSWAPEHLGDPDLGRDVWVIRDRATNTTSAPIAKVGDPAALSGGRTQAVISADGDHIAVADKLSEGLIEIRQRNGLVEWTSAFVASVTKLSLSADGQKLAFDGEYDDWGNRNVFVVDVAMQEVDLVSESAEDPGEEGNRDSFYPALSGNGRWLALVSNAFDLTSGDTNDGKADLFLKDLQTGAITKVAPVGPQDGFDPPSDLLGALPSVNDDGTVLAFATLEGLDPADTNANYDVYTYDTSGPTPVIECVSCSLTTVGGKEALFPVVSANAGVVTFGVGSAGSSTPDHVYRFERASDDLTLVAQTFAPFAALSSSDGCQLAFTSYSDGLTAGDANQVGDAFAATIDNCPGGPDVDPPVIACTPSSADGLWHNSNRSFACTASDAGSGLANPADASFNLTTNLGPDAEWADVFTGSRLVCDAAPSPNCATAGPIGPNMIDLRAPTVMITTPSINAIYTVGATVPANYSCVDNGSGVASCVGPVAPGQALNTSTPGLKSFVVTGTDNVGNMASLDVPYTVVPSSSGPTIAGLIQQVNALSLRPATKSVLVATLRAAEQAVVQRRAVIARALLQAFVVEIRLLVRLNQLPVGVGQGLISQAQAIAAGL